MRVVMHAIPPSFVIKVYDLHSAGLTAHGDPLNVDSGIALFDFSAQITRADLESLILQLVGQLAKIDQDAADKKVAVPA